MIIEMRKHLKSMGWFWYLIVFMFIVPPLVNAIKTFRARIDCIALVDGNPIRNKDFSRVKNGHNAYIRQLQSMGLGQFAQKMSDVDLVKVCAQNLLEQDVADTVGIYVGGAELAEDIAKGVARSAIGKDGKVDMAQYSLSVAANAGMTVAEYEDTLLKKMRSDAVNSLVKACAYEPSFALAYAAKVAAQKKKFSVVEIPLQSIKREISRDSLSQVELENFYQQNANNYLTVAERKLGYAVVERKLFAGLAAPEEDELEEFYERVKDTRFTEPEKVSVSYAVADFADEAERAAAFSKLEEVAQGARGQKNRLSKLAKKHNFNIESKNLIMLSQGELPEVVDQAVAALRQIDGVTAVLEETGKLYVAQIDQIKPFTIKNFDDVRAEIATDVQKLKTDELIRSDVESLMLEARESEDGREVFNRYVEKMHLKTKRAEFVQGQEEKDDLQQSLAKAAFGQNFEEGSLGYALQDGDLVIYLIDEIKNPSVKPLDDVRQKVEDDLLAKLAVELQSKFADELREKVLVGDDIESDLARFKLKVKISDWTSADDKTIAGHKFSPKILSRLKNIDHAGQVLKTSDKENSTYLIWLEELSEKEEGGEQAKFENQSSSAQYETLDGFVASLLKNATIEFNNRTLNDLIPEY